jgi:hypothetical protein
MNKFDLRFGNNDCLVQDRNAVLPNCFDGDKWLGESALRHSIADLVGTAVCVSLEKNYATAYVMAMVWVLFYRYRE